MSKRLAPALAVEPAPERRRGDANDRSRKARVETELQEVVGTLEKLPHFGPVVSPVGARALRRTLLALAAATLSALEEIARG